MVNIRVILQSTVLLAKIISASSSTIVLEGIGTVVFFYQDILHKNKTRKYLNTPKKHNKAHSFCKKCLDKIADKKNN